MRNEHETAVPSQDTDKSERQTSSVDSALSLLQELRPARASMELSGGRRARRLLRRLRLLSFGRIRGRSVSSSRRRLARARALLFVLLVLLGSSRGRGGRRPRRSLGAHMPKVMLRVCMLNATGCGLTCDGAEACGALGVPGAAPCCCWCFAAASLCLAAASARYVL